MEYRKMAEDFCHMRTLNAKKISQIEAAILVRGEINALLLLEGQKEKILAGRVAEYLGLSAGRGTNILNNLEKKGLIEKSNDGNDRRKVYISLTEAGREYIVRKHQKVIEKYEEIFRELGLQDARDYVRITKKMVTIMGSMLGEDEKEDLL